MADNAFRKDKIPDTAMIVELKFFLNVCNLVSHYFYILLRYFSIVEICVITGIIVYNLLFLNYANFKIKNEKVRVFQALCHASNIKNSLK